MKILNQIWDAIASFFAVPDGFGSAGIQRQQVCGACTELTAFRIAVESLQDDVLTMPAFQRANFFRNIFPSGEFVQNQGTVRSNFTIKPSAPSDDQSLWTAVAVSGGITTPGCSPTYEDIGVGFFENTWSPKRRDFRGPIICREHLTYQHSIDQFIEGYVQQVRQWIALTWEFGLRGDVMRLGDWFVDGVKIAGPNAAATAPRAYQGISYDLLQATAVDRITDCGRRSAATARLVTSGTSRPTSNRASTSRAAFTSLSRPTRTSRSSEPIRKS